MKKKNLQELRRKNKTELLKLVNTKKLELTKLTGKMYAGKEKNLKKTKNLKKEIAQILTIREEIKK